MQKACSQRAKAALVVINRYNDLFAPNHFVSHHFHNTAKVMKQAQADMGIEIRGPGFGDVPFKLYFNFYSSYLIHGVMPVIL